MPRLSAVSVEEKVQTVLLILPGKLSVAEAARRLDVAETTVGRWRRQVIEAGRAGLESGSSGGSSSAVGTRRAEIEELTAGDTGHLSFGCGRRVVECQCSSDF